MLRSVIVQNIAGRRLTRHIHEHCGNIDAGALLVPGGERGKAKKKREKKRELDLR